MLAVTKDHVPKVNFTCNLTSYCSLKIYFETIYNDIFINATNYIAIQFANGVNGKSKIALKVVEMV